MTLTLEIPPEVQRELARQAEVQGIPVQALVARLPKDATSPAAGGIPPQLRRSSVEIEAWLDSLAEFSDQIPALPGETFSRTMIYSGHD